MNFHDWDEVEAGWPEADTAEYRAELQSARRELELGMQVRQLRLVAGLSQKDLARMVGTSQPAIARLEAGGGMPRIETLDRVARALGAELVVGLRPVREQAGSFTRRPRKAPTARAAGAASGSATAREKAEA